MGTQAEYKGMVTLTRYLLGESFVESVGLILVFIETGSRGLRAVFITRWVQFATRKPHSHPPNQHCLRRKDCIFSTNGIP